MSNTLILINGHPNSGKSTTRALLKEKLAIKEEWFECDYDKNFMAALGDELTRDSYLAARSKVLTLALVGVQKTNLVFDVLIDNSVMEEYIKELKEYGVESITTVLLYCDKNTQIVRDAIRKNKNKNAPYGFNEGFDVAPSPEIYDIIIDTSQKSPINVVDEIIDYLN